MEAFRRGISRDGDRLALALGVVLAAHLAVCAGLSAFNRPVSDDFCYDCVVDRFGYLGALAHWRATWTGRYSFAAAASALPLGGRAVAMFWPAATLVAWLGALLFAASRVAPGARPARRFAGAALCLFALVETAPDRYQCFYWNTGIANYALPLIGATAMLAALGFPRAVASTSATGPRLRFARIALFALVGFVLVGFNEAFASSLTVALFALTARGALAEAGSPGRRVLPDVRAALAGTLAGWIALATAPGNAARIAVESLAQPGPGEGAGLVFAFAGRWLATVAASPARAAACAAFALGLAVLLRGANEPAAERGTGRRAVGPAAAAAAAIVAALAAFAPSAFMVGTMPPDRVLLAPNAAALVALGFAIRGRSRRGANPSAGLARTATAAAVVAVAVFAARVASSYPEAARFARLWDERDVAIRAARDRGEPAATIRPLPMPPGLGDLGSAAWLDDCIECSYGIEILREAATESRIPPRPEVDPPRVGGGAEGAGGREKIPCAGPSGSL